VSDASSPLGSEGVPYAFDVLEIVGKCRSIMAECDRTRRVTRHREMPVENELVRFP